MQTNEIVPDAQTYLGLIVGAKEGGVLTRVQRYHHLMEANVRECLWVFGCLGIGGGAGRDVPFARRTTTRRNGMLSLTPQHMHVYTHTHK